MKTIASRFFGIQAPGLGSVLLWFILVSAFTVNGQSEKMSDKVVVTEGGNKTEVRSNPDGSIQVNVSPKEMMKIKARGWVQYSDFGATGNGKTDDIDAIAAAHAFANQRRFVVKADKGSTYYI